MPLQEQRKTIYDLHCHLYKVLERNSIQARLLHHMADKWEESADLQSEALGTFEVSHLFLCLTWIPWS